MGLKKQNEDLREKNEEEERKYERRRMECMECGISSREIRRQRQTPDALGYR